MMFVSSLHRSGDWANYMNVGSGIEDLHKSNQSRFDNSGLRLEAVEFQVLNDVPRWVAIFRSGDWAVRLTADRDLQTLLAETQTFFDKEGLRLSYLASYVVGNSRRWAGIYRSGDWAHRLTVNRDTTTLMNELQSFSNNEGLRPIQLIPYVETTELRWAAIYISGDWPTQWFVDYTLSDFMNFSQSLFDKEGLRLLSAARYETGNGERWAGISRGGDWANYFYKSRPLQHFLDEAQHLFDHDGLRLVWTNLSEQSVEVVRLHIKILTTPTIPISTMIAAMREVYEAYGMAVEVVSTETLNLPLLTNADVGSCSGTVTADQTDIFANRNNVGNNEIAIYFCNSLANGTSANAFNGCATHPAGQPGATIASYASQWTLAHEVGHILGLSHCDTAAAPLHDRLMTGQGTGLITNPPPDLVPAEVQIMIASSMTIPA